jgi:hypothetical protein
LRKVAGPAVRHQFKRCRLDGRLGCRQRFGDGPQPRNDPLDIAIHRSRRPVEGNGSDCRRRIRPDAGQLLQALLGLRKAPAKLIRHRLRAGMQVARACIISEPGPLAQHIVKVCCRQVLDLRPPLREGLKIAPDGCHRGLLKHDLRQPHPVRIRYLAGHRAPRQHPAVTVVPFQQAGTQRGRINLLQRHGHVMR